MAQAYYQHLLRDVPKDYAGYLPPTSSGADFYSWFGGFIYGVVDALADQIPWQLLDQQRMAHEVLQSVEAIGRVIGILRRSKNLFSDLFQAIRQYGTAFMKSLSTSMQNIQSQDYFAQGEKTGDVLTRVLLFLVGAVKNLVAFVQFFEREGGTILKLLRKLLGGEVGTLEEGGGGGGRRPHSGPVGKPHGQEPVERSSPEQRRIDRERANAEALAERQRIKQEREQTRPQEREAARTNARLQWTYRYPEEAQLAEELRVFTANTRKELLTVSDVRSPTHPKRGTLRTRKQLEMIDAFVQHKGYDRTAGWPGQEELLAGPDPDVPLSGGTEVDLTYKHRKTGKILRIQTVTTTGGLRTPLKMARSEERQAKLILQKRPGDLLVLVPKVKE